MSLQVEFKKGSQENFDKLTSYVPGCFYLTSDTNRLYLAQSENFAFEITKELAKSISSSEGLPENIEQNPENTEGVQIDGAQVRVGDFYYINGDNILLICDSIDEEGNINWIQINHPNTDSDTYATELTFSKDETNQDKNKLIYNVTLKNINHNLVNGSSSDSSVDSSLEIAKEDLSNIILNVLEDNKEDLADLIDIYTSDEINSMMNDLNAMVFKGGVESYSDLPNEGVKIGDTYVAQSAFTNGDEVFKPGDMFIALGTEENGVITEDLAWTHVSSLDTNTTYSFKIEDGKLIITSSDNTQSSSLTLPSNSLFWNEF